uniref:Uncharacterized protein n=1 Tax=Oryza nivara TaxID=4536 RepID=A0A0E0G1P8_ORYNI
MSSSLLPFLLGGGGGNWKAAVLQSLLSFVVEQEKSVVVLLSNLVRFAMDKVTGTSTVATGEAEAWEDQDAGGKQQQSVIELARGF